MDLHKFMVPSSNCSQNYTLSECQCNNRIQTLMDSDDNYYKDYMQEQLDAPMPFIGTYIAAASIVCTIVIAVDAFIGFRKKKLWFPSKYFSLNAFSLTVLAIAMKLPLDLTSEMTGRDDKLARVSSLVLMSTSMSNFMPSLGSMENNEIILNLAALCILVITIAANVWIRLIQIRHVYEVLAEEVVSTIFMLPLLAIFCSSAVMVPTAKRYIESQYNQMHKRICNERVNRIGNFTTDELRVSVRRYWVMAESGSPQFVIARSVTCVTSSMICLSTALTLLEAHIRMPCLFLNDGRCLMNDLVETSDYKWTTARILLYQSIGVAFCTIAPLLRWFTAAQFKSTMIGHKSFKDEFKVEAYWTQSLKQWRDSPLPLDNGIRHTCKIALHDAKRLLLNLCIGVQILIVVASKLALLISAVIVKGPLFCFSHIKGFIKAYYFNESDNNTRGFESRETDSSRYVLLLEGEAELPKWALKNMCSEVDKLIRGGKKKQSKNVIELLQKSVNFNGVREFDSSEIQSLSSQEPPNCWSLPVVTLASIAISIPNITDHKSKQLLIAVIEGLYFAKLIEKTLDSNGELESIRNAADVAWLGVELYKKWQGKDLQGVGRTHKETLQNFSDIAEKTVTNFNTGANNFIVQDPLNWPAKVIAANSMYRITQTILLAYDDDHPLTDEEMFERLSVMISDILAACLTNLARVIMLNCHSNAIKEREKSIREAARLLGESEEILESLQQREIPNVDPEKAANIEGWRAFMEQDNENPVATASATTQQTNGEHVAIELGC